MPPAVAVGSSVYNLAGEPDRRPDYLKSLIMGHISGTAPLSIGEMVAKGYKNSSILRIRRFLKWSQTDSQFLAHIGVTGGSLPAGNLDIDLIETQVPPWDENEEVLLVWNDSYVGVADPARWVVQHMTRYYSGQAYTYTFNAVTEQATIYRTGQPNIVLNMPDYFPGQTYLYVHYLTLEEGSYWYIYQYNTGNSVLDSTIESVPAEAFGAFYPPIPFRYLNVAVGPDTSLSTLYPTCKRAFRKAFGLNFDDVQEKIQDNESIEDIDYAYAVMAVTLNTTENSSKKYIFKLVEFLVNNTNNHSEFGKQNWLQRWNEGAWPDMRPPWKSIKVESMISGASNYRTDLKWAFMNLTTGAGLLKPGAKVDELWFEVLADPIPGDMPDNYDFYGFNQDVALCWQVTANSWKRIVVTGLQYNNYVYGNDHTFVTAKQAIFDIDGDSEFLVPLHEGILDSLSLVDVLQIATSSSWLILNYFEIYEQQWYETGWFKVVLVGAIIAVSIVAAVLTGGTSLGVTGSTTLGFLTSAGLSAVAALIIAAAVDVIAGILISYLIGLIATELFGEEWGPIIGGIITFIFSFGLSVGSISEAISSLSRPDTWIALATATGNATSSYMQAQSAQIAEDTAKMLEEYSDKAAEVQRKYQELMSGSSNGIDPSVVNRYIQETTEKPADFFKRTLATGSDLVELTLKQIENFTSYSLQLMLP